MYIVQEGTVVWRGPKRNRRRSDDEGELDNKMKAQENSLKRTICRITRLKEFGRPCWHANAGAMLEGRRCRKM
jgi:hypothetical protein